MGEVNWTDLLPNAGLSVIFSNLEVPESRAPYEDEVAALKLPCGFLGDIVWDHMRQKYILSIYAGSFRKSPIAQSGHENAQLLIKEVGEWAQRCRQGALNTTNMANTTSYVLQQMPTRFTHAHVEAA